MKKCMTILTAERGFSYKAVMFLVWLGIFSMVFYCVGCESGGAIETAGTPAAEKAKAAADAEMAQIQAQIAEMSRQVAAKKVQDELNAKEAPVETAAQPLATGVAVTVNGIDITEEEVENKIKPYIDRMMSQNPNLTPEIIQQQKAQMKTRVLEIMIIDRLIMEKAKAANITLTDEQVLEGLEQMGAEQQPPMSLEDIKALIAAQGQDFNDTIKQTRLQMSLKKLVEADGLAKTIEVSEEETVEFYNKNKGRYETPEQIRASHILISTGKPDPNSDPDEVDAIAKAKAEGLLKQIRDGADFATLAKENSACPSASGGGDLRFFRRGQMVPPFDKAAFALEVGQVSDVVKTRFGYHIIKLTDHKEAVVTTLDEVKDQITKQLESQKQNGFMNKYISSLKEEAKIAYPPGKEPKPQRPRLTMPPQAPGTR